MAVSFLSVRLCHLCIMIMFWNFCEFCSQYSASYAVDGQGQHLATTPPQVTNYILITYHDSVFGTSVDIYGGGM
jgi:hypothetical protein